MRDGGRLAAAIEILGEAEARHRPLADALRDWGLSHRFAGTGDRAAIFALAQDALRRRASLAWAMGADSPRALILGAYAKLWRRDLDPALADPHAPAPLAPHERAALGADSLGDAPDWVKADVPDWLWPSFKRAFGERAGEEGRGLAARPPLDLRVNTLLTTREKAARDLAHLGATPTPLSPVGLRIAARDGPARPPTVAAEPAYKRGLVEIQDEGSQIAALVAAARGGDQVVDLCAGAGGKTLALAAAMGNKGQIYAFDADKSRFGDIFERIQRGRARNVQVRHPERPDPLGDLVGRADLVLVDAPCTGSGTWRRRPDAKWRLGPRALAARQAEQDRALAAAAGLVRPGGRIVYVTCSVLPEENEDRIAAFLAARPGFRIVEPLGALEQVNKALAVHLAHFVRKHEGIRAIRLTPATSETDGFTIIVILRSR